MVRINQLLKGPITRATLGTASVLGVRATVQAVTLIILTRILIPGEFATYAALGALAVLMGTLAPGGTQLTLLRDVSRDPNNRMSALQVALGTTFAIGGGLFGLYVFLCKSIFTELNPGWLIILCLGFSELILQPALLVSALALHAQGHVTRSQLLLTLPLTLRLAATLLILYARPNDPLATFVLGHLVAVAIALSVFLSKYRGYWPAIRTWRPVSRSEWRDARGYAIMGTTTSGISELDKVLAAKLLTGNIAGLYAVASRIIGATVLPVIALMLAAMPRLFRESSLSSRGNRLHLWLLYSALTYGIAAGVLAWVCGPYLSELLGETYSTSGLYLRWFAWMLPALALRAAAMNILTTLELPWPRIGLESAGLVFIVIVANVLTPSIGAAGLILALTSAEWIVATLSWVIVFRLRRTRPGEGTNTP